MLAELGRMEVMGDGPSALLHLREAYDTLTDEGERAAVAQMLARTMVFAGGLGEATAFARTAAAALPDGARPTSGSACSPSSASRDSCTGSTSRSGTPMTCPRSPAPVPARACWPPYRRGRLMIEGGGRERCLELCRFALEGGELMEVDSGLLWVVAAMVREFCDDDISAFWDEALAHAFARGSLFASLSVHLWRGYMLWRRGALRDALESLRTANEQIGMWGAPEVSASYGQAFLHRRAARPGRRRGGARRSSTASSRTRDSATVRGWSARPRPRCLYYEGRHAESLDALDEVIDVMGTVRNPVWRPWRSLRAYPLAGLGRTDEAVALLEEELALVRAWGSRSTIGRTLRMVAETRDDPGAARGPS